MDAITTDDTELLEGPLDAAIGVTRALFFALIAAVMLLAIATQGGCTCVVVSSGTYAKVEVTSQAALQPTKAEPEKPGEPTPIVLETTP